MTIPDWFRQEFDREFGTRDEALRLRWSRAEECWHLEQRMGRGSVVPAYISDRDDARIRARDGYDLIMRIRTGTRMPCPREGCPASFHVPVREFREIPCPYCKREGFDGRYVVGFFPLDSSLLDYLRFLDPLRGGPYRAVTRVDRANEVRDTSNARTLSTHLEAATKDDWNRLVGIPTSASTRQGF